MRKEDRMTRLNRFRLSPLALTLGLIVVAAATPASPAPAAPEAARLAGSWVVNVTPAAETGIPSFVNLASFTRDGRVVNLDPVEGAGLGEWNRSADGLYHVTFMGFTTQDGAILRTKVRGTVAMAADGRAFTGPFRTEILGDDGTVLMAFAGTVEGTRFVVEPL
jgi:hypothetical protein